LGLDATDRLQKAKILHLQKGLIAAGHLLVRAGRDGQRRPRNFVVAI
jgi:hypothetical protein